jgi:transposase
MDKNTICDEWLAVFRMLSEPEKRWFAAVKAVEIGYGGISAVNSVTGLSRTTITQGIKEVKNRNKVALSTTRMRKKGAGRKLLSVTDKQLKIDLEYILSETTAGDPMSPLKWTCKSVRNIAEQLYNEGHDISYRSVHRQLIEMGYSLQSNRKSLSRENNPDRDRQFRIINRKVIKFSREGLPVISVDTKKKELVGKFANKGKEWHVKGQPVEVEDHDFRSRGEGIAIPYGAYDVRKNEGFINIGISKDTAEFAVNSIENWWKRCGKENYPSAKKILICADGGGSNGSRNRLWKICLQNLSNKEAIEIFVCHYPPGTSKWNKIEHRMFSYISLNWRGKPLENYEAIIQLISGTRTQSGLIIQADLDKNIYKTGIQITDEEFSKIHLKKGRTLPLWNYSISPDS